MEVGKGVDLLALALLMATLRDWFVICQRRVPVVCLLRELSLFFLAYFSLSCVRCCLLPIEGKGRAGGKGQGPEDQG